MRGSHTYRWTVKATALVIALCLMGCASGSSLITTPNTIRLATWNIEHLGRVGEGCVPRTEAQIAAVRDYVRALNADVISFQEVASEEAALAVFPTDEWRLFVSQRVYDRPQPQCRQDRTRIMGHMRTGFAVRRGLAVTSEPELTALGDTAFRANDEPHGVDVALRIGRQSVRLLSVHLTSGCSSESLDETSACIALFSQAPAMKGWVDARTAADETWLIAGDFNRSWHDDDPFWQAAFGDQQQVVKVVSRTETSGDLIIALGMQDRIEMSSVPPPSSAVALGLSDHEPVLADIQLRPTSAR